MFLAAARLWANWPTAARHWANCRTHRSKAGWANGPGQALRPTGRGRPAQDDLDRNGRGLDGSDILPARLDQEERRQGSDSEEDASDQGPN